MQKNVDNFMPGMAVEVVDDYCCTNYASYVDKLTILDGAVEAVEYAKQLVGDNVYIITNCPRRITEDLIKSPKASKLINMFTNPKARKVANDPSLRIICLNDHGVAIKDGKEVGIQLGAKPCPDMVVEAARRLGVNSNECILIGDSQYDMSAIEAAGGIGVGIKTSSGSIVLPSIKEIHHIGKFFTFQHA
uniref:Putative HAD-hydrolase MK0970 n=1 Tax=Lygus hesperus TaxID=30085 RepID=A0A0A9WRW5_LYGHE